jgi:hypothetical protein
MDRRSFPQFRAPGAAGRRVREFLREKRMGARGPRGKAQGIVAASRQECPYPERAATVRYSLTKPFVTVRVRRRQATTGCVA